MKCCKPSCSLHSLATFSVSAGMCLLPTQLCTRRYWRLACRHGGGVLKNLSDSLVAVIIPEGAHHIDLMFSNELDPPSVKQARAFQLDNIRKWIAEVHERNRKQQLDNNASAAS